MFEALIVTLREGIEAALVVGIILIYLKKAGHEAAARWVYLGLAAGVAASIVCGFLFARLEVSEEAYEGWLMLAGALCVAVMVVWMMRSAKTMKQDIETRLGALANESGVLAAGLFVFTFFMVLREGVETVIFLAAVNLTTDATVTTYVPAASALNVLVASTLMSPLVCGVGLPRFALAMAVAVLGFAPFANISNL